ncbi:calcineurin-binding protein cabin-1-like isoform X2 [Zootermopsis nevadensis]|nr:calcineurin-binding protein cabin-1-like isoform X2 [Zootermopsis nevadensis]
MLREKNFGAAKGIFQTLLENSFLVEITKRDGTEGLRHPALVLKYSCLKNMGMLLEKQGELQGALQRFLQASELDRSDVTLWYRIGKVALLVVDYELACDAFLEGLRCSPRHWPCLDNLVTVLYVLNGYLPCLLYIARAFELDPDFAKGLAFRDKILAEQPSIINDFSFYCKGYGLGCLNTKLAGETGREFIEEALEMREKKRKVSSDAFTLKPVETITLVQALSAKTWLALGNGLVQLHRHIETNRSIRHFCCPVDLEVMAGTVNHAEKDVKPADETVDVEEVAIEDGRTAVNEETPSLAPGEEDGAADARGTTEGDDTKSRKRRRSSLSFLEQWMWGGKRRSARVRSTVKREAEREEGNLEEALRRLVPQSLLPNVMKDDKRKDLEAMKSTENSLNTMDLYKLFERRESTEGRSDDNHHSTAVSPSREKGERVKLTEEGYFGSEKENCDVEEFIQSNTRCDIIDLLTSYVRSLSSKWQLLWPAALPAVFLQAYVCMRQHVSHPSAFSSDEDACSLVEDACITLLYGELLLDGCLQNEKRLYNRGSDESGTLNREEPTATNKLFSTFISLCEDQFPAESLGQLVLLSGREDLFHEEHLKYVLRLYWLKAHLFLNQGNSEIAIQSLHTVSVGPMWANFGQ